LIVISLIAPFNKSIKTGIRNLRVAVAAKQIPRWRLFAGVLGGSFVALQTQVVPIIGVALYSVASIAGQTAMSLIVALLIFNGDEIVPLPSGPWWIYTGGTIGVIYIAFTSTIVQHLGVLTFTLFSVGGTLIGSLLIDLIAPTNGNTVSWFLVSGILMTYLGVVIGGQSRLFKR